MMCRAERLQQDMSSLLGELNARAAPSLPALENKVGWQQKGPLAKNADLANKAQSRHLDKFATCGETCFDLVRTYYAADFAALGYPQTYEDLR